MGGARRPRSEATRWRLPPVVGLVALGLLRVHPSPTEHEIRVGLSSVLCRCTGYEGIVRAVRAAVERLATNARPV